MKDMKRTTFLSFLLVASFGLGYLASGVFPLMNPHDGSSANTAIPLRANSQFVYINPLLMCGWEDGPISPQMDSIVRKLSDRIGTATSGQSNTGVPAGLYYRDLTTGKWFGVNEDETFTPGSLLKVPLMVSYLKLAETDPSVLKKTYSFDAASDEVHLQNFKPQHPILAGVPYTVAELLKSMVADSDNNAAQLLSSHADDDLINEIFSMFKYSPPKNVLGQGYLTPRNFTYFLRVLYNATYLDQSSSEQALAIMASSTFADGLRAGLPQDIKVADKFGERELGSNNVELHDCGIVYYPDHPYALCIMTRGTDFDTLEKLIADLSRDVFDFVNNTRP